MDELIKIYGIGPKLANDYLKYGITINNGKRFIINPDKPIRPQLKKCIKFLPEATQADLKYNPTRIIPRKVIKKIDDLLRKNLKGFKFEIAGSYRRHKPVSRDIDIIVSAPSTKTTAEHWLDFLRLVPKPIKFVTVYAQGEDKISTILLFTYHENGELKKITCKADIFFTDVKSYMYTLLYATGSGQFNIRMRYTAKRLGYLLNQHGLYKKISPTILKRVNIKDEKHLFKVLGMKYLEPQQRLK